jgi:acetyl esterase/lipase
MATNAVIQWTKDSISKKGNPNAVFVTGHSAGGHLGALKLWSEVRN